MAAVKLNLPVFNSSEKTFERWKVEVQMWSEITDLEKKKMGIAVALSLPENESVRAQVMESVPLDDLKKEDGLSTLLKFMEKTLGKDDMKESLEKYEEFKNCTRVADQKISDILHQVSSFPYSYENAKMAEQILSDLQRKLSYLLVTAKMQCKFLVKKQKIVLYLTQLVLLQFLGKMVSMLPKHFTSW